MSTSSTKFTWKWYIRKKGKNYVLGLVDNEGDAPASALTVEVWYDEIPDEVTSDDDALPIPTQFEHAFTQGCVYEVLKMLGYKFKSYTRDRFGGWVPVEMAEFNDAIYDARHMVAEETEEPLTIAPVDIRHDDSAYGTIDRTS